MRYTKYELSMAVLKIYARDKNKTFNKFTVIGGIADYPGDIEGLLQTSFTEEERSLAGEVVNDLQSRRLITPPYKDSMAPGDWLKITKLGERALETGALDELDELLLGLKSNVDLLKLRYGAYDAMVSQHTDWERHASTSCRELITSVLHTISPDKEVKEDPLFVEDLEAKNGITRSERIRHYLRLQANNSKNDLHVVQEACDLMEANYKKLSAGTHADIGEVKNIVRLTEDSLYFLLN